MTPWPPGFSVDDFKTALVKACEDSYQRTSGFDEIGAALGQIFRETDMKMRRIQAGLEGKHD